MASTINASTSSGIVQTADTSGTLQLQTASTNALYIDSSQNVGIGTTSLTSKLNVQGSASNWITYSVSGTNKAFVGVDNGTPEVVVGATAGDMVIRSNQNILFGLNTGSLAAKIDTSGNVLIGASSLPLTNATTGTGIGISPSGVGIKSNMTSGSEAFSVNYTSYTNGTTVYPIVFRTNGTTIGYITLTNTAVAYVTSSDYRLKENVQPMIGALDKVAQLKPVTYTWKSDNSAGQGFIAHELQAVVPDCVTGEKDAVDAEGNPVYQGVDTSFLVATLTAAIQEQQALITSLTARITALEGAK